MVQEGELALTYNETTTDSLGENELPLANTDSATAVAEPAYGLILTPPEPYEPATHRSEGDYGVSFILAGLFILSLIIALKFRDGMKHITAAIFHNLMETRTRHNVFDDTVRETSLIVLLNIMWCASAGIIGFFVYEGITSEAVPLAIATRGVLWGMAIVSCYVLFLYCSYWIVGWVFSDRSHSELWVKGYAASQALMAPAFFVTALLAVCCRSASFEVGIFAAVVFLIGKLAFILKGYRIFFNQFSSWVLFLCYLCSLEIVPLILCYRTAVLLGEML